MPYVKETYITGAVIETIKKFTYTCKNKKMNRQPKENLEKFIRKLRNVYKQQAKILKYVATTEYGKNSLHHLIIINSVELNTITRFWQYGRPNI